MSIGDCIHSAKYGPDWWCALTKPESECLLDICKGPCENEKPRKVDRSQAAQTTNTRINAIADLLECLHDGDNVSNEPWFMEKLSVIRQQHNA